VAPVSPSPSGTPEIRGKMRTAESV
jgi:hypothetical protein